MDFDPLTNDDVADILALLDSLPYDELDLETPRFRLTLRRTPAGWTQSTQILSAPEPLAVGGNVSASDEQAVTDEAAPGGEAGSPAGQTTTAMSHRRGQDHGRVTSPWSRAGAEEHGRAADEVDVTSGEGDDGDGELVAVRAPLPGTFYRAPRPGAAPFVEMGSQVGADTVIGIVETMKLMNSVPAGVAGVVAEFCVANAEFAAQGAALLRIRADR
jgi:acetyl-CoA carboxylase biotin carboxyl carrier protein